MTKEVDLKEKGWVIFHLKFKTPPSPKRNEFGSELEFKKAVEEHKTSLDREDALLREISWVCVAKKWLGRATVAVKAENAEKIREKLEEHADIVEYLIN